MITAISGRPGKLDTAKRTDAAGRPERPAKPERVAKWDNVRVILILCVVTGHILRWYTETSTLANGLSYFIYLFHMPAFVLVSGIFSKRAVREKRYDRVFTFLILYFLIKCGGYFIELAIYGTRNLSFSRELGTAWYALAMAYYYLAMMFLQRFSRRYVVVFSVAIGCIAGYAKDLNSFLVLSRAFAFFPFFVIGFYLSPSRVAAFVKKRWVQIAAIVIVAAFLLFSLRYAQVLDWTDVLLKARLGYSKLSYLSEWGGLLRLLQYAVALLLTFSVFALAPSVKLPFTYIGGRTMTIYALHYVCIEIFYDALGAEHLAKQLAGRYYLVVFVLFGFLLTWVLSLKPFDRFVRMITIPKKEENNG